MANLAYSFLTNHIHTINKSGRFAILCNLLGRANGNLRCYPSNERVRDDVGIALSLVSQGITWLTEHGAILKVKPAHRLSNEKDLPVRKNVYQLTGILIVDQQAIVYMHVKREVWETILANIQDILEIKRFCPPDVHPRDQLIKVLKSYLNRLDSKRSDSEHSDSKRSDSKRSDSESESNKESFQSFPVLSTNTNTTQPEDKHSIFKLYESNVGMITPIMADRLKDAETTYPENWIKRAFEIAVENNIRRWSYIEAILKRWQRDGFSDSSTNRQPATKKPIEPAAGESTTSEYEERKRKLLALNIGANSGAKHEAVIQPTTESRTDESTA